MDASPKFTKMENSSSNMTMATWRALFSQLISEPGRQLLVLVSLILLVCFVTVCCYFSFFFHYLDVADADDDSSGEDEPDEMRITDPYSVGADSYYREALTEFLVSQMNNYQYFLNGTKTSFTESFHNVCNLYYPKGLTMSFVQYKMRKQFAALHWNDLRKSGNDTDDVLDCFGWRENLLNKLIDHLRPSSELI